MSNEITVTNNFGKIMRQENAGLGDPLGKPDKITLHWTAGSYDQTFDHYHFCIKGDATVVQTLSTAIKGSHTWHRNTGNIGISLCAMADGYPVKDIQIEAMAKLVAELMGVFGIAIEDVHDHFYYAKLDGYTNERWDIGDITAKILPKVKWYREQLSSGKITNELTKNIN